MQHQILPRLSGEVTFNRRNKYNLTASDAVGSGCDLYSANGRRTPSTPKQCMEDLLNFKARSTTSMPSRHRDPRLPGGGGYLVEGFATQKCATYST